MIAALAFVAVLLVPPVQQRADAARAEREALAAGLAGLRSGDKWERKQAVDELVRLATPDAWAAVVGALADEKGEVADTAELALADLDPGSLDLLRGREGLGARDPWVRRRIAEALGRMTLPFDGPAGALLLQALADDDAEARRMALFSVERLAGALEADIRERILPRVAAFANGDRDALARARALAALAALDPELAREPLAKALGERDPRLRAAASAVVPRALGESEAALALARLAADPERAVRASAARALGELGTRAAAETLAERLASETEERLALSIRDDLRRLSGLGHGLDPRPWRDWAKALPAGWHGETAPRALAPEEGATRSAFAGMPIFSARLAILVDLSGSIWKVRQDGKTKKEIVDRKLREALEGLPERTRFNLVPYTERPHPWKEELEPATPRNVEAAARFFEDCRESGPGNVWDAALFALEDPEVDTLLVLTDGVPTGGRRNRLELVVPLLLERMATSGVAVDAILVEAPPRIRRGWEELSRATGGLCVSIDLDGP